MSDTVPAQIPQSACVEWYTDDGKRHQVKADLQLDSGLWTVTHGEYKEDGSLEIKNTAASVTDTDVAMSMRTLMELAGSNVSN